MDDDIVIHSAEEFENYIKDRKANPKKYAVEGMKADEDIAYTEHYEMANLMVKVISYLPIDQTIKNIMTQRIMQPVVLGREKTHLQIALELGLMEDEVREMEAFGIQVIGETLRKYTAEEFVSKFNRDRKVENAVNQLKTEMGKSSNEEVQN